jgi:hypothetical protein
VKARHLHDLRGLLAGLIAADDREGLQVVVDAARAAFGVCVHSDSADNRRHYTAMLDRVLDGVHVEREPDGCKWCSAPAAVAACATICANRWQL